MVSDFITPGLLWLIDNQHVDGSWGGDSLFDRMIATCHSSMALLSAGFMPTDPAVQGALHFLTGDQITAHTGGFRRIALLANSPDYQHIAHDDLLEIVDRVEQRSSSPHPDRFLEPFLMKMLIVLGRPAEAMTYVDLVLKEYSPENGWFGRADTTTHAIAALAAIDQPPTNLRAMVKTADRIIRTRCVRHGPGLVSWEGQVSTTAYTVMNLLESPLHERPVLRNLAGQGVRWISSQQQANGSWLPEKPPFGGEGEITHPTYFTAVALRCILAYVDVTVGNVDWLAQASYAQARGARLTTTGTRHLTLSRRWRTAAIVGTSAGTLSGVFVGHLAGLAAVATATTAVVFYYSSTIARWIRSRLNS